MKTFMWGLFALLLAGCGQGFQSASLEENSPDFSSAALASQIVTNGASFNFKSAPQIVKSGVSASQTETILSAAPAPAPIDTYSPTSVNFGTVNVGQSSAIQTLTFKNTGSSNLALSSVALNGNFGWGPATSTICSMNTAYAPDSSCTMAIFFSSQSAGSLSGSLTVMDNTSNSTKVIQLAGVGASVSPSPSPAPAPAAAPAPSPSPSPSSILLTNDSFEAAFSSWSMFLNNSAIGTFLRDSSSAAPNKGIVSGLISVTQSFGNIWDVGIVSESMHPTVGQQYSVSFYAKADTSGRQLMASISQSYSLFGQYFTKQFTLSTTWQQYTFTFTQPVNDSVALVLASGAQNGKVSLDAISFTAGASTPSPSPTPSPAPSPSTVAAPTGGSAVLQQATMDQATIQPESLVISSVVPVPDVPPPAGDIWTKTFSKPLNIESAGWSGYNLRQLINSALLSTDGSRVRLTLQAASSAPCSIDGIYIGHQAAAGDLYDFDGGQVPVLVSGSAAFTINAGASVVTDPVNFQLDHTKNLIVAVHFNATSAISLAAGVANAANYFKSGANETSNSNVSGYSAGASAVRLVNRIEVVAPPPNTKGKITNFKAGNAQVWQIDNQNWTNQNANKSWSIQQLDDYSVRFENRAGDVWANPYWNDTGNNRNEVSHGDLNGSTTFPEGVQLNLSMTVTVEPGPVSTSGWCDIAQVHTTTDNPPSPFYINLDQGDYLSVIIQSPNVPWQSIYRSPLPIVRGAAMNLRAEVMMAPSGNGYARVWLDDVQIANYAGAIGATGSRYGWKFGLYRGEVPETISAVFRNVALTGG